MLRRDLAPEVRSELQRMHGATIRAGLYETAGFGIRFDHGIGKIRLLCPFLDRGDLEIG